VTKARLRRPASGRLVRAEHFAKTNHLRYVVQDQSGGGPQLRFQVAPFLAAFASGELAHALALVGDFHAALTDELKHGPYKIEQQRKDAILIVNNRVQALIGELELMRSDR
jgi:hypothetical protein